MKNALAGLLLALGGPLLWLGPTLFPGGLYFIDYTAPGKFLALASPLVTSISGYFFGREWADAGVLVSAFIPPLTFYSLEVEVVNLLGGYQGTGGGALFMYLFLPAGILTLSVGFALAGPGRKRAAEKKEPNTGRDQLNFINQALPVIRGKAQTHDLAFVSWYEIVDEKPQLFDVEGNFGIVHLDFSAKVSYNYLKQQPSSFSGG
jgi:hypothetical protein